MTSKKFLQMGTHKIRVCIFSTQSPHNKFLHWSIDILIIYSRKSGKYIHLSTISHAYYVRTLQYTNDGFQSQNTYKILYVTLLSQYKWLEEKDFFLLWRLFHSSSPFASLSLNHLYGLVNPHFLFFFTKTKISPLNKKSVINFQPLKVSFS